MQVLSGHLERRRGAPSRREFLGEYASSPGRPVLLTGVVDSWPAKALWTLDWLDQQVGGVVLEGSRVPFRTHIEKVRAAIDGGPLYYHTARIGLERRLHGQYSFPRYHPLDVLTRTELWIGPRATRTPLHFDYSLNLFAQLAGRKRFQLYSPDATASFSPRLDFAFYSLYLPETRDAEGAARDVDELIATQERKPDLDIVVEPVEILFIPPRWEHRVTSLEISRSLSFRWFTVPILAARLPAAAFCKATGALGLLKP